MYDINNILVCDYYISMNITTLTLGGMFYHLANTLTLYTSLECLPCSSHPPPTKSSPEGSIAQVRRSVLTGMSPTFTHTLLIGLYS